MSKTIQISTLFLNNLLIKLETIENFIDHQMSDNALNWFHQLCIETKQQLTITQQPSTISIPPKFFNNVDLIAMLEGIDASMQIGMFANARIWIQRLIIQIKDLINSQKTKLTPEPKSEPNEPQIKWHEDIKLTHE